MMNFSLKQIPERTAEPRQAGLTMIMDKGLSLREAEDFVSMNTNHADLVKLGFGSAYVTPNLDQKIKIYRDAGLYVYFGGTLLEAFVVRKQFEDYLRLMDKYKMTHAE